MGRSEEVGSYAVLCGKVVTKHVKKIIVMSRPVVMTQPTRIGQIIWGGESANYFKFACLGFFDRQK